MTSATGRQKPAFLSHFLISLLLVHAVGSLALTASKGTIQVVYAGPADRFPEYRVSLQEAFEEAQIDVSLTDNVSENAASAEYIIYSPKGPLQDFSPFSSVKAVFNLRAGVEGVVDNPTLPRSVHLTRMVDPGLREGMVEYVVGHVLRYHLSMDTLWNKKQAGEWSPPSGSMFPLARQRTIGILGFGELGGSCAEALTQLNFQVYGWSRSPKEREGVHCCHGSSGLDTVLKHSDILVLLLPSTPETENIICRKNLAKCKQGVRIINAGRGSSIDEDDLLEALDSGKVAGATLDVFKTEPLPEQHGFWKNAQVFITPHIAAKTRTSTASKVIAENIRRSEAGEQLLYAVDRDAGY